MKPAASQGDQRNRIPALPIIMTITAAVLWSTGGVCVRLADHLDPWEILFWRALFMGLTATFWMAVSLQRTGTTVQELGARLLHGMPVTLCASASLILYIMSIKNTNVADSLLIQGTGPLFIIIFGRLLLKDPLDRTAKIAVAGIIAGLLVIFLPTLATSRLEGNIYGLAKAAMFAANALFIRRQRHVDMVPALALSAWIVAAVSLIFTRSFAIHGSDFITLGYLGIIQTGVAFLLFTIWSRSIPSTYTGIIVTLEAVLGPVWAWVIINEKPALHSLAGGILIIAALIFNSLNTAGKARLR